MILFLISAIKIIVLLGFLILIHESGHFCVAKLCKVKVNDFSIGFGPVIWKKQGKETKYALRLIPLGGFVSMEDEEGKDKESKNSFAKASIPKRIAIVAAGAIVNIIFAIVAYFILMSASSSCITNEVDKVMDGYPAQDVGIQSGDKIIELDGKKIKTKSDLNMPLIESQGNEISIKIERNGNIIEYKTTPVIENKTYYIGIEFKKSEDTFANHLIFGAIQTKQFLVSVGENFKTIFTGNVGVDQMVGPVGISQMISQTSGIYEFVYMLAIISLSLGITNLLPIPALDGGKILILIIEAIRRKPMKQDNEMKIQLLGFAILITLSIVITYNDILNLF